MRWFRIIYIWDVGRRDAARNYPHESDFIEIPLFDFAANAAEEASAPVANAQPNDLPTVAANDSQKEIEA